MTPEQNRLYQWLLERVDDPVCPSYEEMRIAMGLASRAGIHRIVQALKKRGLVETPNDGTARNVRAVVRNPLHGVPTDELLNELGRRGISIVSPAALVDAQARSIEEDQHAG